MIPGVGASVDESVAGLRVDLFIAREEGREQIILAFVFDVVTLVRVVILVDIVVGALLTPSLSFFPNAKWLKKPRQRDTFLLEEDGSSSVSSLLGRIGVSSFVVSLLDLAVVLICTSSQL